MVIIFNQILYGETNNNLMDCWQIQRKGFPEIFPPIIYVELKCKQLDSQLSTFNNTNFNEDDPMGYIPPSHTQCSRKYTCPNFAYMDSLFHATCLPACQEL